MPKISDEERQALKAKFPNVDLELISHPTYEDEAVARPPTEAEWRIFRQKQEAKAEGDAPGDFLVEACIVWPDKDGRAAAFKKRPAMREVWAGELTEIAGATRLARRSKL